VKKIYLAGNCDSDHRTTMQHMYSFLANYLPQDEYEIYVPWMLKIEDAWSYTQEEWASMVFNEDIKAIQECDYFIMISFGRESSAGTNFEQGFAYALGKNIIVLQVTDTPTSLMTYCGCNVFLNSNDKHIHQLHKDAQYIKFLITDVSMDQWCKTLCETVLT